jgi:hypothetical protein
MEVFGIILSVPAAFLVNLVYLYKGPTRPVAWYSAVPFCTIFAFVLVLLQYSVSEALYGIDGDNGPFS